MKISCSCMDQLNPKIIRSSVSQIGSMSHFSWSHPLASCIQGFDTDIWHYLSTLIKVYFPSHHLRWMNASSMIFDVTCSSGSGLWTLKKKKEGFLNSHLKVSFLYPLSSKSISLVLRTICLFFNQTQLFLRFPVCHFLFISVERVISRQGCNVVLLCPCIFIYTSNLN